MYISAGQRNINGRIVHKYLLNNCAENFSAANTAQAVMSFLSNHQHLCATFSIEPTESFEGMVIQNPYLTINGRAVSLSSELSAPTEALRNYTDQYFSETLIQEPIRCPKGHIFEKSRAEFWAMKAENMCPIGEDHTIGNLATDEELSEYIAHFRRYLSEQQQRNQQVQQILDLQRNLTELKNNLDQQNQELQQQVKQLSDTQRVSIMNQHLQQQKTNSSNGTQKIDPWAMGGAASKVMVKVGGKKITLTVCKMLTKWITIEGTKEAGRAFGKTIAKNIPVLSFLMGIGFGIYRCRQGQYSRAAGEVASGLAACFPGYGTACSAGMDLFLAGYDVHEAYKSDQTDCEPQLKLDQAYQVVGIDLKVNPNPTREDVDKAYREQMLMFHSDKAKEIPEMKKQSAEELTALMNACRDEIYKQRGWT